jgi:hypothetical protein
MHSQRKITVQGKKFCLDPTLIAKHPDTTLAVLFRNTKRDKALEVPHRSAVIFELSLPFYAGEDMHFPLHYPVSYIAQELDFWGIPFERHNQPRALGQNWIEQTAPSLMNKIYTFLEAWTQSPDFRRQATNQLFATLRIMEQHLDLFQGQQNQQIAGFWFRNHGLSATWTDKWHPLESSCRGRSLILRVWPVGLAHALRSPVV